ncbi:Sporulation domain protein [Parvibaculum lavamentivorans DS-1]|uniref:Sporulation domain protein n=1 Tax=Parvibaculum lavamentivorans (strain DS-1 / DSM 13023 / NCIMB 13966) TaxID=402881 RepID=A7HXP2_PARL1|nr:Sporulation domain protein [Parvibaculum lavamentivorans DS-1]
MRRLMRGGRRGIAISLLVMLVALLLPAPYPASASSAEDEAAALMKAGADSIERGQYDKAAVDFSNALDSGGLTPEGRALAYHHRGVSFLKVGQQDAAIADYTRAITANALPAMVLARAYYNRGIAYSNTGKVDAAERDYLKTIELTPDYAAAYHNLANLERRRHAYDDAILHYTAAIDNMQGRERKLPLFGRALALEQSGDLERAAADLRQALILDPEFELAQAKLTAISPQLAAVDELPSAAAQSEEAELSPQIVPSTVAPFQTAASGQEAGKVIRIASVGGWRTTATRFPAPEPAAKAMAAADGNDTLVTGSLRPAEALPAPEHSPAAAKQAAAASKSPSSAEQARYRLQLGAFREPDVAAQAWEEISRQAPGIIGRFDYAIQKADLGSRGIFYRLRAGGFAGIGEARTTCKSLEAHKIECIVVDG